MRTARPSVIAVTGSRLREPGIPACAGGKWLRADWSPHGRGGRPVDLLAKEYGVMGPINRVAPPSSHVVISGCSGGGKSTLLDELARRDFAVVQEAGRRIVREELETGGRALPWIDLSAFAERALALAASDRDSSGETGSWVFFDRSLIDAAAALERANGTAASDLLAPFERYHPLVFMAPPWPQIFTEDAERRHTLSDAIEEYDRLLPLYLKLGYQVIVLPKVSPSYRAEFVLRHLHPGMNSSEGAQ
jgi:predicted ATPase